MSQCERVRVALTRGMSLFDIAMIGVGGISGAGIPLLNDIAAARTGLAPPVASLVNGLIALIAAPGCAGQGSALPGAGRGSRIPSRRPWPASAAGRSS